MNNQDKSLILVRKLKEGFLSFIDDLLEVFPKNKKLFLQRIISYQLPDTCLYKLLKKNINTDCISKKNEYYLKYELFFLNNYEQYLNENYTDLMNSEKYIFNFGELYEHNENIKIFDENIDLIWKWIDILVILIKNIDLIKTN